MPNPFHSQRCYYATAPSFGGPRSVAWTITLPSNASRVSEEISIQRERVELIRERLSANNIQPVLPVCSFVVSGPPVINDTLASPEQSPTTSAEPRPNLTGRPGARRRDLPNIDDRLHKKKGTCVKKMRDRTSERDRESSPESDPDVEECSRTKPIKIPFVQSQPLKESDEGTVQIARSTQNLRIDDQIMQFESRFGRLTSPIPSPRPIMTTTLVATENDLLRRRIDDETPPMLNGRPVGRSALPLEIIENRRMEVQPAGGQPMFLFQLPQQHLQQQVVHCTDGLGLRAYPHEMQREMPILYESNLQHHPQQAFMQAYWQESTQEREELICLESDLALRRQFDAVCDSMQRNQTPVYSSSQEVHVQVNLLPLHQETGGI